MFSRDGFTLTEILIAMMLTGLIVLAVVSVDLTSHRFFQAARGKTYAQDEVKIAMAHLAKNIQLGTGSVSNPGFIIGGGGTQLQINQDLDCNGTIERSVSYAYRGTPNFDIFYDPNIAVAGNEETITGPMIASCNFASGGAPNEVVVTIISRPNPALGPSPQNPETTLTSSIVSRGMSAN